MTQQQLKDAWCQVGDELEAIGLKLKLHLQQEAADDGDDDDADGAFARLASKIDVAIDAAENAFEDEAVRDDLRETGRRLVDAMSTTFRAATQAARREGAS